MRAHLTFVLLLDLLICPITTGAAESRSKPSAFHPFFAWSAPAQTAQGNQRHAKSQAEADALRAMGDEKDPAKKLGLATAFLKQYPDSEMLYLAHTEEMVAYLELGDH